MVAVPREGAGGRLGEEYGAVDESYGLFLAAEAPAMGLLPGWVCGGRNESPRGGGLALMECEA